MATTAPPREGQLLRLQSVATTAKNMWKSAVVSSLFGIKEQFTVLLGALFASENSYVTGGIWKNVSDFHVRFDQQVWRDEGPNISCLNSLEPPVQPFRKTHRYRASRVSHKRGSFITARQAFASAFSLLFDAAERSTASVMPQTAQAQNRCSFVHHVGASAKPSSTTFNFVLDEQRVQVESSPQSCRNRRHGACTRRASTCRRNGLLKKSRSSGFFRKDAIDDWMLLQTCGGWTRKWTVRQHGG